MRCQLIVDDYKYLFATFVSFLFLFSLSPPLRSVFTTDWRQNRGSMLQKFVSLTPTVRQLKMNSRCVNSLTEKYSDLCRRLIPWRDISDTFSFYLTDCCVSTGVCVFMLTIHKSVYGCCSTGWDVPRWCPIFSVVSIVIWDFFGISQPFLL